MNPGENKHVFWHNVCLHGLLSCPNCLSYCTPCGKASPASSDHLGYFRYRVLCVLGLVRRELASVNICSPSPANHNRAPWGSTLATILPQGHSGKSGSQKQMGFLQKHGRWDAHLGHRASQVRTAQIKTTLFVLLNIANTVSGGFSNLQSAVKLSRTLGLYKGEWPRRLKIFPP